MSQSPVYRLIRMYRTDGAKVTLNMAVRGLLTALGLRMSETLFLHMDPSARIDTSGHDPQIRFESVTDVNSLHKLGHERLSSGLAESWLKKHSVCYVGKIDNNVAAYCWIHQDSYYIDQSLGAFELKDDEAWVGPLYVDPRYRGMGLATSQIQYALKDQCDIGTTIFLTAISSGNLASIRCFCRCGFRVIGLARTRRFLSKVLSSTIVELTASRHLQCLST